MDDQRPMEQRGLMRIQLVMLLVAASAGAAHANGPTDHAALDDKGNIYVASGDGRRIQMGNTSHCAETLFAEDHQTVGCLVAMKGRVQNPEEARFSLQLEIYGRGGDKRTIDPGARINEWHFWKDGEAVAVASGMSRKAEHYTLYESATGHLVEELPAPSEENMLPQ